MSEQSDEQLLNDVRAILERATQEVLRIVLAEALNKWCDKNDVNNNERAAVAQLLRLELRKPDDSEPRHI